MPDRKSEKKQEIYNKISEDLHLEEDSGFATRESTGSGFATAKTIPQPEKDKRARRGKLRKQVAYSAKSIFKQAVNIRDTTADYDTIRTRITEGGQVTGTNLIILLLAIIIASVGLNMNSTAVIIGAMLISPLMGTIQLMGLSIATVDGQKFKKAILGFLFQVVTALAGSSIYFLITPIKTATSELLARTQPTIWDVLIATAGGLAGAIASTRKEAASNVIPGVAIATALMPPLCTCGYSIANGHWNMLLGAGFLFIINMFFILVSNVIVLYILEVPEVGDADPKLKKRMKNALIRNAIIILIPSIIMAVYVTKQSNNTDAADSNPVTPRAVSTLETNDELKVLYPEIQRVQVGQVEEKGEDGELTKENVVILTLRAPLTRRDTVRIRHWVNRVYSDNYLIEYRMSGVDNPAPSP